MSTEDLTAQQRVVHLLRSLNDAKNDYGETSTGDGVRLMPSGYHEGSYAELERVLALMRGCLPGCGRKRPGVAYRHLGACLAYPYWHVAERYLRGDTQTIEVGVVIRRGGSELLIPRHCELVIGQAVSGVKTARVRVYRWNPIVKQREIERGVRWITQTMYDGRRSKIQLPDDLYRRVLGLPPRDERLGKRVKVAA